MRYLCNFCGEETWLRTLSHYPGEPIDRVSECCGSEDYVEAGECTLCGNFLPVTSLCVIAVHGEEERVCNRCMEGESCDTI